MLSRNFLRSVRRIAHLSPMQRVMRGLRRRDVDTTRLDALELFAGAGTFHTLDYIARVRSLEGWEIDPERAEQCRRNLPTAKIHIGDAYQAVKNASKRYGLLVVDNPMGIHGGHVEHFDLFPAILDLAEDDAVMILNVIPAIREKNARRYPYLLDPEHAQCRSRFYRCDTPHDIPMERMETTYRELLEAGGFTVEWLFFVERHFVYYLVLKLRRGSLH